MLFRDILRSAAGSLWRHKLRTSLTTTGVTIGIATLVASISVGLGVRKIIDDGFKNERLREITVFPGYERQGDEFAGIPAEKLQVEGTMNDARRLRIKKQLASEWRQSNTPPAVKTLSAEQLSEFAAWPHVVAVRPQLSEFASASCRKQRLDGGGGLFIAVVVGLIAGWACYRYRGHEVGGRSVPYEGEAGGILFAKRLIVLGTSVVALYYIWDLARSLR